MRYDVGVLNDVSVLNDVGVSYDVGVSNDVGDLIDVGERVWHEGVTVKYSVSQRWEHSVAQGAVSVVVRILRQPGDLHGNVTSTRVSQVVSAQVVGSGGQFVGGTVAVTVGQDVRALVQVGPVTTEVQVSQKVGHVLHVPVFMLSTVQVGGGQGNVLVDVVTETQASLVQSMRVGQSVGETVLTSVKHFAAPRVLLTVESQPMIQRLAK